MIKRLTFILLLLAQQAGAADYFVRTDGNNGNAGTGNTAGTAWRDIGFAIDNVTAGDDIYVDAGTYTENLSPQDNGSLGSGYVTVVATNGAVQVDSVDLVNGNTWLRYVGITFDCTTTGAEQNATINFAGTTSFLEFWHCTFRKCAANGFRGGPGILSTNLVIVGCHFEDFGSDGGASAFSVAYRDMLFAYNYITNCRPDGIIMFGKRGRFYNNHTIDMNESDGGHPDIFQTGGGSNDEGWEGNIVEGHFQSGGGSSGDEHVLQASNGQDVTDPMRDNIFRGNVWHNNGTGGLGINQTTVGPITNISIYQNTHVEANRAAGSTTTRYGDTFIGAGTDYIRYKGHILYEVWGEGATANLEVVYDEVTNFEKDYNLAYDPDGSVTFHSMWTEQANEKSNTNPDLVDVANDDFRLASDTANNASGPLTTVTSASSSGTTFTVADAAYFRGKNTAMTQYGGNLTKGDTITVGTDILTIVSISGNDITVAESFTWANGDPVFWLSDATPNLGAYPYSHVRLTSASYTVGGLVTPNGDTRMVVQFRDGMPYEVDNTAPYNFTHVTGAEYWCYPLHPSKTLKVLAALTGTDPIPHRAKLGVNIRLRAR